MTKVLTKECVTAALSSTSALLSVSSRGSKGVQQQGAERSGEFFKDRLVAGDGKNPFAPQPTPHRRDGIRERHILLARPIHRPHPRVPLGQLTVQACYQRVQSEQARRHPQHGLLFPAACTLQAQVRAHFLEGGFLIPTTDVG